MVRLVDDLLDVSRISRGTIQLRRYLPTLTDLPKLQPLADARQNQPAVSRWILFVDDNPDAALRLAMRLKLKSHQIDTRSSGQAGLAAAKNLRPEVILLNIGMPGLNGYDTCRLICEQPGARRWW